MIKILILTLLFFSCNKESFEEKVLSEYKNLEPQVSECKKEIDNIAKDLQDRDTYTDNSGFYFKTVKLKLDQTISKLSELRVEKIILNDEWKFNKLLVNNCNEQNFKFFFSFLKDSHFCSGALFELLAYYRALGSDLIEKKASQSQIDLFKAKTLEQIKSMSKKESSFLEQLIALNFLQTIQEMNLIGMNYKEKIQAMVTKYDRISATLGKRRLYSLVDMNKKQYKVACDVFTKIYKVEGQYAKEVSSQIKSILKNLK